LGRTHGRTGQNHYASGHITLGGGIKIPALVNISILKSTQPCKNEVYTQRGSAVKILVSKFLVIIENNDETL